MRTSALVLACLILSGCSSGVAPETVDGYLLQPDEIPDGFEIAPLPDNPHRLTGDELVSVGGPGAEARQTALDGVVATYWRTDAHNELVQILAYRFAKTQERSDWLATGEYARFVGLCGLRPSYGMIQDQSVVLLFAFDEANDGGLPRTSFLPDAAIQATQQLARRTGAELLCSRTEMRLSNSFPDEGPDHLEPNEVRGDSAEIHYGSYPTLSLAPAGDVDWYHLVVEETGVLCFTAYGHGQGIALRLEDDSGQRLDQDAGDHLERSFVRANVTAGTYFLRAAAALPGQVVQPYTLLNDDSFCERPRN